MTFMEASVQLIIPFLAVIALGLLAMKLGLLPNQQIHRNNRQLGIMGAPAWDSPSLPKGSMLQPTSAVSQPLPVAAEGPLIKQLVWAQSLAVHGDGPPSPFPTLDAIDFSRKPGLPSFAAHASAPQLELLARKLVDDHWSEMVWLTGLIDQNRFDAVCHQLEAAQADANVQVLIAPGLAKTTLP